MQKRQKFFEIVAKFVFNLFIVYSIYFFVWRIWKREAENEKSNKKGIGQQIKEEIDHEVDVVADKTGMKGWQVLALFIVVVLAIIGLVGWCVWRFFKKKRKGKDGKGKDVPPDTEDDKDDLQALVANAEEDLNPEDKKGDVDIISILVRT